MCHSELCQRCALYMLNYGEAACDWPGKACAVRVNNDVRAAGGRWACSPLLNRMIKCYVLFLIGMMLLLWICVHTQVQDSVAFTWIIMYLFFMIVTSNACVVCYLPSGKLLVELEELDLTLRGNVAGPVPANAAALAPLSPLPPRPAAVAAEAAAAAELTTASTHVSISITKSDA